MAEREIVNVCHSVRSASRGEIELARTAIAVKRAEDIQSLEDHQSECSLQERHTPDVTVELSDWSMSTKLQRRIARQLTTVLAELFEVGSDDVKGINIRFHSYPPADFAVGGQLLSDVIPIAGRLMKRFMR